MLAIPSHIYEKKDFKASFQNYIFLNFGEEVLKQHENDINSYLVLREQSLVLPENNALLAEEIILKYHSCMKNIYSRFYDIELSMIESNNLSTKPKEMLLPYTWYDAYKPTLKCSNSSFVFDWVNILWNYSAYLSRLGSQLNRSTDEGIKTASKYFQQCAGIYEFISSIMSTPLMRNSQYNNSSTPLPCLSNESLTFVKQLMLAQAQLCYYEKSVRDKKNNGTMKSSVIAKLAYQTAQIFKSASTTCKLGVIHAVLDSSWANHVDYQAIICSAAAEYWQSQASKETALVEAKGFGEEIARLSQAEAYLNQALGLITKYKLSQGLADSAQAFLRTVVSSKQTAEHENRVVYMDTIPLYTSLPEIVGIMMVKPLPIADYNTLATTVGLPLEKPLFNNILPKKIITYKQILDDRIKLIVNTLTNQSNEATNSGRSKLSSIGLPNSVESIKLDDNDEISDQLWDKVLRVQSIGGIQILFQKLNELYNLSQNKIKSTISSIEELLNKEESQDIYFRTKHNNNTIAISIAVPSSINIISDYKKKLNQLKDVYITAQTNSDEVILQDIISIDIYNNIKNSIENNKVSIIFEKLISKTINNLDIYEYEKFLLCNNKNDLYHSIEKYLYKLNEPNNNVPNNNVPDLLDFDIHENINNNNENKNNNDEELNKIIKLLELQLVDMALLIENRDNYLNDLINISNDIINNNTIKLLDIYMTNININNINNLDNEIQKEIENNLNQLNTKKTLILETITNQNNLLNEIIEKNQIFIKLIENNSKIMKRNEINNKIEYIINKFYQWYSQINDGIGFYLKLQSRLSEILQDFERITLANQLARQQYESNLIQENLDRELALKLQNEMSIPNNSNSSNVTPEVTGGIQPTVYIQPNNSNPYPSNYPVLNNNVEQRPQIPNYLNNLPNQSYPSHLGASRYLEDQTYQQQQQLNYQNSTNQTPTNYQQANYSNYPIQSHSNYQPQVQSQSNYQPQVQSQPNYPPQQQSNYPSNYPQSGYGQPQAQTNYSPQLASNYQPQPQTQSNYSTNYPQPPVPTHQNYNNYPPNPQNQPYQNSNPPPSNPIPPEKPSSRSSSVDADLKVRRICDMGFKRNVAEYFLKLHGNDEEAAINGILSATESQLNAIDTGSSTATTNSSNQNTSSNSAPPPKSSGGFLSKVWGKK